MLYFKCIVYFTCTSWFTFKYIVFYMYFVFYIYILHILYVYLILHVDSITFFLLWNKFSNKWLIYLWDKCDKKTNACGWSINICRCRGISYIWMKLRTKHSLWNITVENIQTVIKSMPSLRNPDRTILLTIWLHLKLETQF